MSCGVAAYRVLLRSLCHEKRRALIRLESAVGFFLWPTFILFCLWGDMIVFQWVVVLYNH